METYGCAANQGDSSIMKGILWERGHKICRDMKDADCILINTCIVINTTEQRMLHRLNTFKKEEKPVIVAGCMASVLPYIVKKILPNAKLLPPHHVHHVADIVEGKNDGFYLKEKVSLPREIEIKVNFPISDGCLFNCSYCITKKARGNLISYSPKGIVEDIGFAVQHGCKEVRLTSQDTASYGKDNNTSLPSLISRVCSIKGKFRIRVGMMHPLSALPIFNELMDSYAHEKVYKFLHLPLQSGSNDILKKMRRGYSVEDFLELVKKFRERYPDGTLATDVIVAFPSETEEDFQKTYDIIKKIQPDIVNVTRFSPRPYTDAKKMKERVNTFTAKERSRKMTELAKKISLQKNRACIGKNYVALILEKQGEWMIGKTENYKSIFLKEGKIGEFVEVEINDATATHLFGNRKHHI
ncbi:MAG: tRNA (N(6)-L-threonylcarbamoyladenosine(37)-C(2))-methylthiotransferase, partial [Thermoplasmata archaeon]